MQSACNDPRMTLIQYQNICTLQASRESYQRVVREQRQLSTRLDLCFGLRSCDSS